MTNDEMNEPPTLEQLQILDLLIGKAPIRAVDSLLQPWVAVDSLLQPWVGGKKTMMEYWLSDKETAENLIWLLLRWCGF